jgi:outer membrane protein OmpA-like peptidoglycan-associated protein
MAEDWAIDVKKYVPNADDAAIAGIVRYCGIALRNRDSSLVSFTDPTETDRVRENYLKKKLALTDPDSVLDAAIAAVGERMKGDTTRNRVTVYYLLAEHFGKLGLFGVGTSDLVADAAPVAPVAPAYKPAAPLPLVSTAEASSWGEYLPIAVLLLGGAALFALIVGHGHKPMPVAAPVAVVAPAVPVAAAIPEGEGLISDTVDGKPFLQVYFDTAKTDVSPDIVPAAAVVKAYVDSHPGAKLAVSGYNDPRGDAAMNAELSKNRAMAVRDALAANGISLVIIELVKPAETTDASTTLTNARRVDVSVE